jgi:hypothetical protein
LGHFCGLQIKGTRQGHGPLGFTGVPTGFVFWASHHELAGLYQNKCHTQSVFKFLGGLFRVSGKNKTEQNPDDLHRNDEFPHRLVLLAVIV